MQGLFQSAKLFPSVCVTSSASLYALCLTVLISRSLQLQVVVKTGSGADKSKRMMPTGGVALACDPCASGSLVAHPRAFELQMPIQTVAVMEIAVTALLLSVT